MPRRLKKLKKFWSAIELLPQWCAVLAEWRWLLGPEFDLVARKLTPAGKSAVSYPRLTADGYGQPYRVVTHDDGQVIGVAADGARIALTGEDVALHELSQRDMLRDLASALGMDAQVTRPDAEPDIWQVGSVLSSSIRRPVFFACGPEQQATNHAVEHLAARHQEPFVLLVPTPRSLDFGASVLLETRHAMALVLQDILALDEDGNWCGLQPRADFVAELVSRLSKSAGTRVESEAASRFTDGYGWASQAELVRATNQVLGEGTLHKGVLSRACTDGHVETNGKPGRGSRVKVGSFLTWAARKFGIAKDEQNQVRNAIVGEISERTS